MTHLDGVDLREITKADVYIGDDLAAHLTRNSDDKISFDYIVDQNPHQKGCIRDRSVSWSLLRSDEYPVVTTGSAVPAFFAGLLPEGVRLGVVTSSTKTSTDDHLTLLLAIGAGNTKTQSRTIPTTGRKRTLLHDNGGSTRAKGRRDIASPRHLRSQRLACTPLRPRRKHPCGTRRCLPGRQSLSGF